MARLFTAPTLLFSFLFLCTTSSYARDFLVGGSSSAWKVPSSTLDSLNRWAESNRFRVGDTLVWKYDPAKDIVLRVSREDYLRCNATAPLAEGSKDGKFKVVLDRPGAYYFISGAEGACEKGEKLIVVVMTPKARVGAPASAPAPAPGSAADGPAGALAPVAGAATRSTVGLGVGGALVSALMVSVLVL